MAMQTLQMGAEVVLIDSFTQNAKRISGANEDLRRSFGLASNSASNARQHFVGLERTVGGMGAAFVGMKAISTPIRSFAELTDMAGQFGQTMAVTGAVLRAGSTEMQMLEKAAIDAGLATQFSPLEAAKGLETLATAGQTAREAVKTLIPVLDLATGSGGQLKVDQAADAVIGTLNAYQMSAEQAGIVTDKLLKTTLITNFTTRDFAGGLAKAASSGAVFNQTLDDALITMGLLRNRNIDASSSSTAYREMTRRLATEKKALKDAEKAGVEVYDKQTGKMRSAIDITMDLADASASWTEAERNAMVYRVYGARGLLAFSAIQKAQYTVTRNGVDTILKGRDAIRAMREEMSNAGGTAKEFRDRLLDTFQGQKTLLMGTVQTLAVVVGKPLTAVFKPIVAAVVGGLTRVVEEFNKLPDSTKESIARFVVIATAVASAVIALASFRAAFMLLGPQITAMGAAVGGFSGGLLPVAAALLLVTGLVKAFGIAWREDLGGIGSMGGDMVTKVVLAFNALRQLFMEGAISGPIMDDFLKAENHGVLNFVTRVYLAVHRLINFIENIGKGFEAVIMTAEPHFESFRAAIEGVTAEFSGLAGLVAPDEAQAAFDAWGQGGQSFGGLLAGGVVLAIRVLTGLIEIVTGVIQRWDQFKAAVSPIVEIVGSIITEIYGLAVELANMGGATTSTGNEFVEFGHSVVAVFASIAGFVKTNVSIVKGTIMGIAHILTGAVEVISGILDGDWSRVWNGYKHIAVGAITFVVNSVLGMTEVVLKAIQTIADITGAETLGGVSKFGVDVVSQLREGLTKEVSGAAFGWKPTEEALPTAAPTLVPQYAAEAASLYATNAALTAPMPAAPTSSSDPALIAAIQAMSAKLDRPQPPPTVKVELDGRELASSVREATSSEMNLGYGSFPDDT